MNIKKFFGLLMIFAVAIFAFTACSSDDDDEKTGTFEYAIGCPSFEGDVVDDIQKINDAFNQAFGVTDKTFKLTGTQSECNRKAKEYAMKAQTALANDGSFGADVEFVNVTTGDLIHSFTIKMDDNSNPQKTLRYTIYSTNIIFHRMEGYHVEIVKKYPTIVNKKEVIEEKIIFDGSLGSTSETIDLMPRLGDKNSGGTILYNIVVSSNKGDMVGSFELRYYFGMHGLGFISIL